MYWSYRFSIQKLRSEISHTIWYNSIWDESEDLLCITRSSMSTRCPNMKNILICFNYKMIGFDIELICKERSIFGSSWHFYRWGIKFFWFQYVQTKPTGQFLDEFGFLWRCEVASKMLRFFCFRLWHEFARVWFVPEAQSRTNEADSEVASRRADIHLTGAKQSFVWSLSLILLKWIRFLVEST